MAPPFEDVRDAVPGLDAIARPRSVTKALLTAVPKADLHCHLDGSLRLSTILELARAQGVTLPAGGERGLEQALHCGRACGSLEEYLAAFDVTLSVLQEAEALRRTAFELGLDAAAENVRYLEVRFCPALHVELGLTLEQVVEAVLQGLTQAAGAVALRWGVILCGLRHLSPETSTRLAELAVVYAGRGVVGFDLAGAEAAYPAAPHAKAFHLARSHGLACTVHAGEAAGPESIAQALHVLGAQRIGHGTRLREDAELLEVVRHRQVPVECCLTSNVQTGAVRRLDEHPLRDYLARGLRVCVNTDNRLISGTTVSQELWLAHSVLGLEWEELVRVVLHGFQTAFLPERERRALVGEAVSELGDLAGRG